MVLRTIERWPAARLRHRGAAGEVSGGALLLNMGTLYPSLMRLEQRGYLRGAWGTTEANRRARVYHSATAAGRRTGRREGAVGSDVGDHRTLLHGEG